MAKGDVVPRGRWLERAGLVCGSLLVGLVLMEAVTRAIYGIPIFSSANWVTQELEKNAETQTAAYDPRLGWYARPDLRLEGTEQMSPDEPDFSHLLTTTDSLGIRMNDQELREPPRGAILAVGDSFTWGSEVSDHETYPAHLERILGQPLINGAYGGWGVDQMWLRAEQLLPELQPQILILSPLSNDNLRNAYRRYGRAFKPYFEIVDGDLRLANVPVPRNSTAPEDIGYVQSIVGYSYAVSWASRRLGLQEVWVNRNRLNDRVHENSTAVEITCRLLPRFRNFAAEHDARFVFAQLYSGQEVLQGKRHWFSQEVLDCARAQDIYVVDTYDAFRAVAERSDAEMLSLYNVWPDGRIGHMSPAGNHLVAQILASHLAE